MSNTLGTFYTSTVPSTIDDGSQQQAPRPRAGASSYAAPGAAFAPSGRSAVALVAGSGAAGPAFLGSFPSAAAAAAAAAAGFENGVLSEFGLCSADILQDYRIQTSSSVTFVPDDFKITYLCEHLSPEKLIPTLQKLIPSFDWDAEKAAMIVLKARSVNPGTNFSEDKNQDYYYDRQLGRIALDGNSLENPDEREFKHYMQMFGKTPTKLVATEINKTTGWISRNFIETWKHIEEDLARAESWSRKQTDGEIKTLPVIIANCKDSLQTLILPKSGLLFLPPELGLLKQLKTLSLPENHLTYLPLQIRRLTNLKYFFASGNKFTCIPTLILCELNNLKTLALSKNPFFEAPFPGILCEKLTQLQTLKLYRCKINALPNEIGGLLQLKHLSVGENPLKNLPESIYNLQELTEILATNTKLTKVPLLAGFPKLEKVTFLGPHIGIPKGVANSLESLLQREQEQASPPHPAAEQSELAAAASRVRAPTSSVVVPTEKLLVMRNTFRQAIDFIDQILEPSEDAFAEPADAPALEYSEGESGEDKSGEDDLGQFDDLIAAAAELPTELGKRLREAEPVSDDGDKVSRHCPQGAGSSTEDRATGS